MTDAIVQWLLSAGEGKFLATVLISMLPVIEQRGGRVTFENRVDDPFAIDVDRLFERFYQGGGARSSAGAGLGLAIVSQLAASMVATDAASLEGDFLRLTLELQ